MVSTALRTEHHDPTSFQLDTVLPVDISFDG